MTLPTDAVKPAPILATGAALTAETWADFVTRLKYHSEGEGAYDHSTADALFIVQNKRLVSGIDRDYASDLMIYCDDYEWFSPLEFWADLDEDSRADLNKKSRDETSSYFTDLSTFEQWLVLEDLEDHTVTGYAWEWEYVNSHFTKEAAEAFIKRKSHDYRELRVFVESQYWAWEFNAIKNAIMNGQLVFKGDQGMEAK